MELKANELRIGNLIYAPSGVEKYVFGTRYKTILYTAHLENPTYGEAYDYECKPIPLTEEWLLKCNFNFRNFGYEFSVSNHLLSGNFYFMINGFGIKIYYLHQLQNLYFALTNKELEIKM